MVRFVSERDEFDEILASAGDKLVVVDFTATWCGPCKQIAPIFEEQAGKPENANMIFLKVDVDDGAELSEYCQIQCMPTFQFYRNGQKVGEFSGANPATLLQKLDELRT